MIVKLLILLLVGLAIYKFFGGKFPTFGKTKEEKKIEEDTLVECENCGTYVTLKESIVSEGKHYCSKECANKKTGK
ncbi:MAG: PP0621 family protein [Sulfurovum sp.]|nr:PP0621 family protein [Sulfurovum sp.]MDD3601761.1 PP0621 family protein [Sulfurovum sp.]